MAYFLRKQYAYMWHMVVKFEYMIDYGMVYMIQLQQVLQGSCSLLM